MISLDRKARQEKKMEDDHARVDTKADAVDVTTAPSNDPQRAAIVWKEEA